jgi:hypothetical protein
MAPTSGPELSSQPHRPVLVLAWFEIGPSPEHAQLAAFIAAVKAAGLPAEVSLYIGTYGPNQATADAVKALPAIYAPLFSIQPSTSRGAYRGRRLTAEQNALLDPKYDRPVPLASAGKPLPASDHLEWGLELGRRFRPFSAPVGCARFCSLLRQALSLSRRVGHRLKESVAPAVCLCASTS